MAARVGNMKVVRRRERAVRRAGSFIVKVRKGQVLLYRKYMDSSS